MTIRPFGDEALGDTVAKLSRCGTELYVNTSCSPEDQLWAIGQAVDHLRGLPALGAQSVRPLRWSLDRPRHLMRAVTPEPATVAGRRGQAPA